MLNHKILRTQAYTIYHIHLSSYSATYTVIPSWEDNDQTSPKRSGHGNQSVFSIIWLSHRSLGVGFSGIFHLNNQTQFKGTCTDVATALLSKCLLQHVTKYKNTSCDPWRIHCDSNNEQTKSAHPALNPKMPSSLKMNIFKNRSNSAKRNLSACRQTQPLKSQNPHTFYSQGGHSTQIEPRNPAEFEAQLP